MGRSACGTGVSGVPRRWNNPEHVGTVGVRGVGAGLGFHEVAGTDPVTTGCRFGSCQFHDCLARPGTASLHLHAARPCHPLSRSLNRDHTKTHTGIKTYSTRRPVRCPSPLRIPAAKLAPAWSEPRTSPGHCLAGPPSLDLGRRPGAASSRSLWVRRGRCFESHRPRDGYP
jgi:hypothetical protein